MDAKITLSFDKEIVERAKSFADEHHISLSRLTEFIYRQLTTKSYGSLEELPISDWVNMLAEGQVEYQRQPRSRKSLKNEYLSTRK
ncbi:DUF6364 family protein [Parapedobacter tibetensis]|uniref:DUF6364 family protein n=1 Tax=Parapedobacter tibetensis TaxID=2972951 RepID=UPI00214DB2EA|nr:DUF6364 family protein [Parapedobacter tibetensis]